MCMGRSSAVSVSAHTVVALDQRDQEATVRAASRLNGSRDLSVAAMDRIKSIRSPCGPRRMWHFCRCGMWRTFVRIEPNSLHTAVSECPPAILIDDGALSAREDEQRGRVHTMSGRVLLGNSGRKLRKSLEQGGLPAVIEARRPTRKESMAHSACGVFRVPDL
jgi:hypothetical protein